MPALFFEALGFITNIAVLGAILYYFFRFKARENELTKREGKIDIDYHQAVDSALNRERKILADATEEADQILTNAQYVKKDSKEIVDHALQKMTQDIQKESVDTASNFLKSYQTSLGQLETQSLTDFQNVIKGLQSDLQKQVKDFHEQMLPNLEKELESYKQNRLKQTEATITQIVQKASQEILNKAISLEDHQSLVLAALEKAKKEGVFDL